MIIKRSTYALLHWTVYTVQHNQSDIMRRKIIGAKDWMKMQYEWKWTSGKGC